MSDVMDALRALYGAAEEYRTGDNSWLPEGERLRALARDGMHALVKERDAALGAVEAMRKERDLWVRRAQNAEAALICPCSHYEGQQHRCVNCDSDVGNQE